MERVELVGPVQGLTLGGGAGYLRGIEVYDDSTAEKALRGRAL